LVPHKAVNREREFDFVNNSSVGSKPANDESNLGSLDFFYEPIFETRKVLDAWPGHIGEMNELKALNEPAAGGGSAQLSFVFRLESALVRLPRAVDNHD
jgi:hypothetical protein